jgi:hypothetical protein
MTATFSLRRWLGVFCAAALTLSAATTARAWDAATTHAGMTERAIAGSNLHAVLVHQMGRALGPFEPLKLHATTLDADTSRALNSRFDMLDSAGGYKPSPDGVLTAIGWVKAGAVLAKTPPELGRHHFLDPDNRTGLDDGPGLSGTVHATRLTLGGGAAVRDAATGGAFDLEGMPATEWLKAPRNDLGVDVFFDEWQRSVSAKEPAQRETALVRALLAMGGVLSVLEDMGQPAFVRNDFRGEFHDDGSDFEIFVADRFGAVGLPRAEAAVVRPDFDSFFVAADGKGLAQATRERFFSGGTLPRDFRCVAGDTPVEAAKLVNQSLGIATPTFDTLDLAPTEHTRYLVRNGVKLAAYRRVADKIVFSFDAAVYADVARAWLPRVTGYAAGLANHLMRGKLQVAVSEQQVTLTVSGLDGVDGNPVVHVYGEDEAGSRQEVAATVLVGASATVSVPKGVRKLAAIARGRDRAGTFVATGELTLP